MSALFRLTITASCPMDLQYFPMDSQLCYIEIESCEYYHKSVHCDLKVSRSQAKINENFANYFLKTKANNKCVIVLKCTCKGLQKSIRE